MSWRARKLAIAAAAIAVGVGLVWALDRAQDSNRAECVDGGGTIAHVHGGSGGWVCLPGAHR